MLNSVLEERRPVARRRLPAPGVVAALVATVTLLFALLPSSATAANTEVGLYAGTESVPGAGANDSAAVELGVRFSVRAAGSVTGVRFYKNSGNTGQHTGSVWDAAGRRLAQVTFTAESASGWQVAHFSQPVPVVSGQSYTASYHTASGHYAAQIGAFAGGATIGSGSLRGQAGVFRYGASAYPTSSWRDTAYFVDPLFLPQQVAPPTSTPPTSTPPTSTPPVGSGFPDAAHTGVPAGTSLRKVPGDLKSGTGWSWDSANGCINVTSTGVTLSGLDVAGCVEVYANNVTITKSRITSPGDWWGVGARGVSGLTVSDTTISGGGKRMAVGIKDVTGSSTVNVLRTNIADWSSGIQISAGVVQDNFVHDPGYQAGDHTNGFTSNGGRLDGSLTLKHNTFLNTRDQADAISLFQDFGVIQNVTVDGNLMAGGSYALYGGAGNKGLTRNVKILNNEFSTRYLPDSGAFGPVCCYDHAGSGNVWSGNAWYDGPHAGQTIAAP